MIALVAPTKPAVGRLPTPFSPSRCEASRTRRQREVEQRAGGQRHCRETCEALILQYSGRMLAVARRMLRSEDDAADAVQDALMSAFASIHRFRANSQLYTWLHRIVVNACLMKLRTQKRRAALSLDSLLPTFDDSGKHTCPVSRWPEAAVDSVEREETRALVRECIDQLPNDYRTILMLRDIEQLDTDETARLLGLSRAAVKTRLHRARQALRTLLEPHFVDVTREPAWHPMR